MHPMSKKEKKPEDVTPEEQTEQAVPTEETEAEAPNPLLEELEALKKSLSDQEDKLIDLVGVGPQGMHGLRPVHHVLILHRGQAALGAVAVDRGAAGVEGHAGLPASGGHHGALHSGVDEGHPV